MSSNSSPTISGQYRCKNCLAVNHNIAFCPAPIISYGILLYRNGSDGKSPEILLIRRRLSLEFIEVIRGDYYDNASKKVKDVNLLGSMFEKMTHEEHEMLTHVKNFDRLCQFANLFETHSNHANCQYSIALETFNKLTLGIHFPISYINNAFRPFTKNRMMPISDPSATSQSMRMNVLTLDGLLLNFKSQYELPEVTFPKGHRNFGETELEAALREFNEETGLSSDHIKVDPNYYYVETFKGSNNKMYQTKLFVAEYIGPPTDQSINHDYHEISGVCWYNENDALSAFRPYHKTRQSIVSVFFERLRNNDEEPSEDGDSENVPELIQLKFNDQEQQ